MEYRMPEKEIKSMPAFSSVMLSPSAVSVNCLRAMQRFAVAQLHEIRKYDRALTPVR